ncbi:alcohol dehydrogenase [Aspergillus terreus]|uniref:Alcohol dehydrogenase n=1 Tax=Aspergillus terreus TaxID=33178 RepID=A0A5M3Z4K2_ASPTE|nr:hypothetical protein ATETN484_0009033600 [Aspergillus terreus]GFF17787.1 alcohol dehydrogenase [Aspergillus terreus]
MPVLSTPSEPPSQMKAVVFKDIGTIEAVDRPKPQIQHPTDAIVKVLHTSICGTDLHIMRGHVPTCVPGRILGHEGVGVVDALGSGVSNLQVGDCVLISCISACGTCKRCRAGMTSHCTTGGWILGHTIDGTQAEYVRVPHAGFSLYVLPPSVDAQAAVALSDAFPTAYECAILPGNLRPGCTIAVVGAGPVGLAVLVLAKRLFAPRNVVLVGKGEHRLQAGRTLGADHALSSALGNEQIIEQALAVNDGEGFDVVVECVGIPETFDLCQKLLGLGGVLTNVGVHGTKADLHLQDLWAKNICNRLVDTTTLGDLVNLVQKEKIDPGLLISHRFAFSDIMRAYDTFKAGSSRDVLKVVITTVTAMFNTTDESSPGYYGATKTALLLLDFHSLFIQKAGGQNAAAALKVAAEMRTWAKSQGIWIIHALIDTNAPPYPTCKDSNRLLAIVASMRASGGEEAPELRPDSEHDHIFLRRPGYASALKAPVLEEFLREKGIKSLVLTGLSTSGCVMRTAVAATDAEFVVTVLSDGCADGDQSVHDLMLGKVLNNRSYVCTAAEFRNGFLNAMKLKSG